MRRLALMSLAALAALALTGAASAKEGGIELASLPVGVGSGEPWETTIRLLGDVPAGEPGVRIRHVETGRTLTFTATTTKHPKRYAVRVVFPERGFWTVEAFGSVSGRAYTVGPGQFFVAGPEPARVSARNDAASAGFPVWPTLGGGLGLLLPAVGTALVLRRRR